MSLFKSIAKFKEKEGLWDSTTKILVAVSGGMDSMALLKILYDMKISPGVAHVNYKLRGEDSTADADLVLDFCQQLGIPCYLHEVSQEEQISLGTENLQNTARNIRYRFFNHILKQEGYDIVATAHHKNDLVETFLLHALRGSGLKGLRSIQPKSGNIVRPMLCCTQEEIQQYAHIHKIPFRIDRSNLTDQYNRNYIRRHILPSLQKRWPQAITTMTTSTQRISEEYNLLQHLVQNAKANWVSDDGRTIRVGPISQLRYVPGATSLLYYLTTPYGLTLSAIQNLLNNPPQTGSDYSTHKYHIILDRDFLTIQIKQQVHLDFRYLIEGVGQLNTPIGTIDIDQVSSYQKENQKHIEYVDGSKINFPLTLRTWQSGDTFLPIGMKGRSKKISDLLIDAKINLIDKEHIIVLEDRKQDILWVVGHRLSHNCRITDKTRQILKLQWSPSQSKI